MNPNLASPASMSNASDDEEHGPPTQSLPPALLAEIDRKMRGAAAAPARVEAKVARSTVLMARPKLSTKTMPLGSYLVLR